MAAAVEILALLLLGCWAFTSADPFKNCNYNAIVGETFTIPLDVSLKARLRWRTNSEILYDSRRQTNMFNVNGKGDLILTSVKKEDEGEGAYIYEIMDSEGVLENTKTVTLCVHDSVQKPRVTHECDKPPGSVTFTCDVTQTEHVTYEWLEGDSNVVIARTKVLTRELSGSNSFKCVVSKFSSSKTSDQVQHECKFSPDTDQLFGMDFWVMVGILAGGGGLVLVLIIATIVCCTINRKKRRLQIKEEEELRLRWSDTNHQCEHQRQPHPHHHHNHRPNQTQVPAAAGHTGPRPQRSRQNRPRTPDPITGQPLPSPRRQTPATRPSENGDEEIPPPLPQPRKKAPKPEIL